jgi:hypothetical protein
MLMAQDEKDRMIYFGIQYKPVFPNEFLGAGEVSGTDSTFFVSAKPVLSNSFGMVLRFGITKTIAYEIGLNRVQRYYRMNFEESSAALSDNSRFGILGYEIPNQLLIYVRLTEKIYMNNAFGISLMAFASDVQSYGNNDRFRQISYLNTRWFIPGLTANVGFEYRTRKWGFFYLGGTLLWPLKHIANTTASYQPPTGRMHTVPLKLRGSYVTLDIRYFFYEDPKKAREKKKRKQMEEMMNQ